MRVNSPDASKLLRPARPVTVSASGSRRPFRFWMTGSLAVVMAALCAGRGLGDDDSDDERTFAAPRVMRHSPYGVAETVQRIEAAARRSGQVVLVTSGGEQPVIVLASAAGGTPVVMTRADSAPDVPLSVQVREGLDGGADVLIADASAGLSASLGEMPQSVADEIAALPDLLDRAFG